MVIRCWRSVYRKPEGRGTKEHSNYHNIQHSRCHNDNNNGKIGQSKNMMIRPLISVLINRRVTNHSSDPVHKPHLISQAMRPAGIRIHCHRQRSPLPIIRARMHSCEEPPPTPELAQQHRSMHRSVRQPQHQICISLHAILQTSPSPCGRISSPSSYFLRVLVCQLFLHYRHLKAI